MFGIFAKYVGFGQIQIEAFDELTQEVAGSLRTSGVFAINIGAVAAALEDAEPIAADRDIGQRRIAEQLRQSALLDGLNRIVPDIEMACKTTANRDLLNAIRLEFIENVFENRFDGLFMHDQILTNNAQWRAIENDVFDSFCTDIDAGYFHNDMYLY